jgi:hypothetical protein
MNVHPFRPGSATVRAIPCRRVPMGRSVAGHAEKGEPASKIPDVGPQGAKHALWLTAPAMALSLRLRSQPSGGSEDIRCSPAPANP